MDTFEIATTVEVKASLITDLLSTAGMAIGYWATSIHDDEERQRVTVKLIEPADETNQLSYVTYYAALAAALVGVSDGKLAAREDLRQHAQVAVVEDDAGEIDSEIADVVVQYALFGDIVFG